jgi:hypothetical protein
MRVDIDHHSRLLSELADGSTELDDASIGELGQDLRFQAELAQYKKLLRALRSMRSELVEPPMSLVDEVLAAVDEQGDRHAIREIVTGRRVAYFGGLAAATAAGVGSALVLARRRRLAA